jgi:hypothetical protein
MHRKIQEKQRPHPLPRQTRGGSREDGFSPKVPYAQTKGKKKFNQICGSLAPSHQGASAKSQGGIMTVGDAGGDRLPRLPSAEIIRLSSRTTLKTVSPGRGHAR